MPFAVFRRHQRKLLAIFAILAMFAFVVADSLPRLLSGNQSGAPNPVVVKLYGRTIRRSDLSRMINERNDANQFFAQLSMLIESSRPVTQFFGPLTTEAMVDALILEHEADRLGMPIGPKIASDWLKRQRYGPFMTKEVFELILRRFNNRISGEQLLTAISNQVRLANVQQLLGYPVVTPLDVFNTFRDQNERVSARAVGFRVDDYLSKVAEPSDAEVDAYYEKYKDVLPDPNSPTPGFKVPRQVKVEVLSMDGEALARSIKDRLTEPELLAAYENRKNDFRIRSPYPDDIFAGDPPLPPQVQPFSEVRFLLANQLAEEKARAEIAAKFETIRDQAMIPFAEKYLDAMDENTEAKRSGGTAVVPLPKPDSLEEVAKKAGLDHEISPALDRALAEHYGLVSRAHVGLERFGEGRKFVEELFDANAPLYDPIEMADAEGRRYLLRKLEDNPPRIPSLADVRADVIHAWKMENARPIAEKAAQDFAETIKKAGGKIAGEIVEGHPVIKTSPISKLQPGVLPGQFFLNGPPVPTEIDQIPHAGTVLRDAYFGLNDGDVAVAPNEPKTTYYVLTLDSRIPATFDVLYAPNGDYERYKREALDSAIQKLTEEWMKELRAQAGVPPGWVPPDEAKSG